jgi:hypothetical protein
LCIQGLIYNKKDTVTKTKNSRIYIDENDIYVYF